MKPEINESQFALGANLEFQNGGWKYPLLTPAMVPTRHEEKYAGYDMGAEIQNGAQIQPLFIQYKASEFMVGNSKHREHFPGDYHRFKINQQRQHNILTTIADYEQHVYYVAPMFHTINDYITYHNNDDILNNSIFATCRGLPAMEPQDRHTMAYTPNKTLFLSEPVDVTFYIGFSELINFISEDETTFKEINYWVETIDELVPTLREKKNIGIRAPEYNENAGQYLREVQEEFLKLGVNTVFLIDGSVSIRRVHDKIILD
jgi:hypothetical protein